MRILVNLMTVVIVLKSATNGEFRRQKEGRLILKVGRNARLMVDEGKLDPNEYSLRETSSEKDGQVVVRRQTVMVDGKQTIVETNYMVHHVEYDLDSGMGRFQLVESDAHAFTHKGGNAQLKEAYDTYGAGEAIETYNNASQ